jgi:thiamine-phosphate diphosphorylase
MARPGRPGYNGVMDTGEARRAALGRSRLMVIVGGPSRRGRGAEEAAREAAAGGARLFQLREKGLERRALLGLAERVAGICRGAGALLIVNDFADVAVAAGADGVHGGETDLPPEAARRVVGPARLVGASAHGAEAARRAAAAGADYVGVGTIFGSPTKPLLAARGPAVLREALPALGGVPAFAIGGITRERLPLVLATGVHGVAVASAIVDADDIAAETAAFLAALRPLLPRSGGGSGGGAAATAPGEAPPRPAAGTRRGRRRKA